MKATSNSFGWFGAYNPDADSMALQICDIEAVGVQLIRDDGYTYHWIYPNLDENQGCTCYLNGEEITTGYAVDYSTGIITFTEEIPETVTHEVGGVEVTDSNIVTADFVYLLSFAQISKYNTDYDLIYNFSQFLGNANLGFVNAGDIFYHGNFNGLMESTIGFGKGYQHYLSLNTNTHASNVVRDVNYKILPLLNPSFEHSRDWTAESGCTFTQVAYPATGIANITHGDYVGKIQAAGTGLAGLKQTIVLDAAVTNKITFLISIYNSKNATVGIRVSGGTWEKITIPEIYQKTWYNVAITTTPSIASDSFEVCIWPQILSTDAGYSYIDNAMILQLPTGVTI